MYVRINLLWRDYERDSTHVNLLVWFRIRCNVLCCLLMIYLFLRRIRVLGTRCPAHVLLVSTCRRVTLHIVLLMHPAMLSLMFRLLLVSRLLNWCSRSLLRCFLTLCIRFNVVMMMFLNIGLSWLTRCNPHRVAKFTLCLLMSWPRSGRRLMSFLLVVGLFPVRLPTVHLCCLHARRRVDWDFV